MTKISRKELKKDEFAAEMSKTYEFVQEQRDVLIRYGIVAAVVAIVGLGVYWFITNRQAKAHDELSRAIHLYYDQTPAPGVPPDPKARAAEAEKLFRTVADKYSMLYQGKMARYYLGIVEADQGKNDQAVKELRAVADKNDARIAPLAKYALAGVYRKEGKPEDAARLYRDLADHPSESVPKETALLALADTIAPAKPAEATRILEDLKKDAGVKTIGTLADQRLAELKQK